ncbi:MAG: 30S ribosomal protein S16 [Saprospiraceae bacterium]
MVRLRLQRKGRKGRPFYHIVAADQRSKRDGRNIERLGSYNPMTNPATIEINKDAALEWLNKGAQPSDTVRAILRFKGVLYLRHLMGGVKKGALTEEQALAKYEEFVNAKDSKVAARFEVSKREKAEFLKKVSGTAPVIEPEVVEEPAAEEEAPVEEPTAEADAPATEETTTEEEKGE